MFVLFNIYSMRKIKTYSLYDKVYKDRLLESNNSWVEIDGKLCKDFKFSDFSQSLEFINKISNIFESENHHPEINWIYNKITLSLSTHDAGDIITDKDIRLSQLIDEVLI